MSTTNFIDIRNKIYKIFQYDELTLHTYAVLGILHLKDYEMTDSAQLPLGI